MHGNEATGTLALLDLIRLFQSHSDALEAVWEELSLVMVLQVNPDGAERFTRRNAMNVDLNRDAKARVSVETRLLSSVITKESPHVAVNLHDQRNLFSVSGTENPATISFLAPSFNPERAIDESRLKCMKLIASMAEAVAEEIPGHIGRYTDEFYPTAFGEYVQQMGVPCILIESGAYWNDPGREKARKMNVKSILRLMSALIDNGYQNRLKEEYLRIPENDKRFLDVVFRNVKIRAEDKEVMVDIGLMEVLSLDQGKLISRFKIEDIGDLRYKRGFEEYDVSSDPIYFVPSLQSWADLSFSNCTVRFSKGFKKVL